MHLPTRCKTFLQLMFVTFAASVLICLDTAAAAEPGMVGATMGGSGGEDWLVPSPITGLLMHAQLFRPAGNGPFPLAVINHGSEQDARVRNRMPPPRFTKLTAWLLQRGYAVLVPQRPGHGVTGGPYLENQGWCLAADFRAAGNGTARSILAAIRYMQTQDFVDADRVIAIGNSAGGWGVLALAAENPPGVTAIVNFAGGVGGRNGNKPNSNCSPDRLVQTAGEYGNTARTPTLWLYSENDTFFGPDLSNRMASAFRSAGGRVVYRLLPPVKGDGHALMDSPPTWSEALQGFLDRVTVQD